MVRINLLYIFAGGSSQRLPSYSVLGKIFAPVPVEGKVVVVVVVMVMVVMVMVVMMVMMVMIVCWW